VRSPRTQRLAPGREDPPRPGVPPDAPRRHVGQERLTDQSVALIIKRRAQTAALPAELLPKLSGHSLRAGYATAAAAAGIEERKIANVTRHKNLPVLRRYIRTATAFDDVGEVL
jgi:integrase